MTLTPARFQELTFPLTPSGRSALLALPLCEEGAVHQPHFLLLEDKPISRGTLCDAL
jgi:hypothetical protein